jgi:hypothetical protein
VHGFVALALAAIVACAAARTAGVGGTWLGALQLVPTVVLLLGIGLLLDAAVADPPAAGANANASAAAVVLAIAAAVSRRPPRHLAIDVVLAGAGEAHALGIRRHVARLRRDGVHADEVAVLHVAPCGAGRPVWWSRDGLVLALRYHPQLVRLAEQTAREEGRLGARAHESRGTSGARAARAAGWPALAIGCVDRDGAVPRFGARDDTADRIDTAAMDATLELALGVIARLDAELAAGAPAAAAPPVRRRRRTAAAG